MRSSLNKEIVILIDTYTIHEKKTVKTPLSTRYTTCENIQVLQQPPHPHAPNQGGVLLPQTTV